MFNIDGGFVRRIVIQMELNDRLYRRQLHHADAQATALAGRVTGRLGGAADRASLAFAGLGLAATSALVGIARTVRQYEKELTLASLAEGADGARERFSMLRKENALLAKSLRVTNTETATLQKSIAELGVRDGMGKGQLSTSALRFSALSGGEIDAERAAKLFFRITRSTRGDLRASPLLASQALVAATATGAGVTELTKELEALQTIGSIGFSQEQLVALSAVLAEIDPTRRESIRTAIFRQITSEVPRNAQAFAALFGRTGIADLNSAQAVREMSSQDPAEFFQRLAEAMQIAADRGENVAIVQEQLGLNNQRDKVFLTLLTTQQERYAEVLTTVQEETAKVVDGQGRYNAERERTLELERRYVVLTQTLDGRLKDLRRATQSLSISTGTYLVPAMNVAIGALTGFLDSISENKVLSFAAAIGILAAAFIGLRGAYVAFSGTAMAAGMAETAGMLLTGSRRGLRSLFRRPVPRVPGGIMDRGSMNAPIPGLLGNSARLSREELNATLLKREEIRERIAKLQGKKNAALAEDALAARKHQAKIDRLRREVGILESIKARPGLALSRKDEAALRGKKAALTKLSRRTSQVTDTRALDLRIERERINDLKAVTRLSGHGRALANDMLAHRGRGGQDLARGLHFVSEGIDEDLARMAMTESTVRFGAPSLRARLLSRLTGRSATRLDRAFRWDPNTRIGRFFHPNAGVGFRAGLATARQGGILSAGRFAIQRGAGAIAGGPVGLVVTAISLLAPAMAKLGNLFTEMSQRGGTLGAILKTMAIIFNTLAIAGKVVNLVFDAIIALIKGILKITGISWIWGKLMEGSNAGQGGILGAQERIMGGLDSASARLNGGKTVNVTNNVSVRENEATFFMTTASQRAAAGITPS